MYAQKSLITTIQLQTRLKTKVKKKVMNNQLLFIEIIIDHNIEYELHSSYVNLKTTYHQCVLSESITGWSPLPVVLTKTNEILLDTRLCGV